MSKYYIPKPVFVRQTPDLVRLTLPVHFGCTFAYLTNDLTIGLMVGIGFILLNIVRR